MRTVANIKAGGLGRLSGITHSVFLLLAVLVFARAVAYVPLAVLAGILIKVGIDILDYRMLRRLTHIPKKDAFVMIAVFLLTVFVDLIFAVGVGVGVVLAWITYYADSRKGKKKFAIQTLDRDDAKFVEIIGPMFFANSARIVDDLSSLGAPKKLTIDCSKATFMDISFVYALEDFLQCVDKNATNVDIIIDERLFSGRALNELKYLLRDNIRVQSDILEDEKESRAAVKFMALE